MTCTKIPACIIFQLMKASSPERRPGTRPGWRRDGMWMCTTQVLQMQAFSSAFQPMLIIMAIGKCSVQFCKWPFWNITLWTHLLPSRLQLCRCYHFLLQRSADVSSSICVRQIICHITVCHIGVRAPRRSGLRDSRKIENRKRLSDALGFVVAVTMVDNGLVTETFPLSYFLPFTLFCLRT